MESPSLPAWVEHRLEAAPHHSDRRGLAQIHGELFGPISHRTFEEWPLMWRRVGDRAVTDTRAAIALAYQRFESAPKYRSGRAKAAAGVVDLKTGEAREFRNPGCGKPGNRKGEPPVPGKPGRPKDGVTSWHIAEIRHETR